MITPKFAGASSQFTAEIAGILPHDFSFSDRYRDFSHSVRGVMSGVIGVSEVVIKPFLDKEGAEHEAMMLDIVERLGIPTLKPVSLCLAGTANYLVTRFDPTIRPLDQLGLYGAPSPRVANIAQKVGRLAKKVHEAGMVHGDLRLGNLFETANEDLGVMDLDLARLYFGDRDEEFVQRCGKDIKDLLWSARGVVDRRRIDWFRQEITESYGAPAE